MSEENIIEVTASEPIEENNGVTSSETNVCPPEGCLSCEG